MTARAGLEALLAAPEIVADPAARQFALEMLMDICIRSMAAECVSRHAGDYLRALPSFPAAHATVRADNARRARYYIDYARYLTFDPALRRAAIEAFPKTPENAFNPQLYLRRLALKGNLRLAEGDYAGARGEADRMLSLVASLENPQDDSLTVATALNDAIAILLWAGDTERAYGVYRAGAPFIAGTLGKRTPDYIAFRFNEAQLLEAMGLTKSALQSLDAVSAALAEIELDAPVKVDIEVQVQSLRAAGCIMAGDLACAEAAIAAHPLAARFTAAAPPQSQAEVAYLAARALVASAAGRPDPIVAASLLQPVKLGAGAHAEAVSEVWRLTGAALASSYINVRQDGLREAGRAEVQMITAFPGAGFAAWYRPGFVDQAIIALALAANDQDGRSADAAAFALHQLAARQGGAFDADAMTALSQARDEAGRRTAHQALRLRARRDKLEREALQAMAALARRPATGAPLRYDIGSRRTFRDFATRIDVAASYATAAGVSASGANLTPLDRFQAVLRPNEAALALSPIPGGGFAYMCVRKDRVARTSAAADLTRAQLDMRLLQSALTAGHAPSEALDVQFPVASAVRLYDVLIRPFAGCLRPGDDILWLRSLSSAPIPLAALLERAPPKAGAGYDLSAADWLVRRHAVAYAGSAGAVVASRSRAPRTADFDFLGIGDPVLTGARFAGLAPLPETRAELRDSARGFSRTRLLVGEQATERGLRAQMIGGYRYLSFATHGLIRDEVEGLAEPALVLTPVSAADPANDGLLTAAEIADLRLSAGFVALSACNTANVDLARMASELPALTSAFAVAGVPATLATLWPVDSGTSQTVVTSTFTRLGEGRAPAQALAEAQRAFLAAPPGKAWRHPRFWAPFVILGNGGAVQSAPAGGGASVEVLTVRGGEVLGLVRTDRGVAARLISDRDAKDRHAAGLRLSGWRQDTQGVGAMGPVMDLGGRLAAGGYGDDAPVLEFFDKATGAAGGRWTGAVRSGLFGAVVAAAPAGPGAWVFAVNQIKTAAGDGAAPVIQLFTVAGDASPRLLAEIEPDKGVQVDDVALARVGDALLVAYGARRGVAGAPPFVLDDYDLETCAPPPVARLELRDLRSGARRAAAEAPGWSASAALAEDGHVLLAGAFKSACADEARAAVARVGPDLRMTTLYIDGSLGESRAAALSPMDGGRVLVAASKTNLYYMRLPAPPAESVGALGVQELPVSISGMILTLGRDGRASEPRMLESGSYLFVSAAEASDPKDILIGGAIGEQAAIFHLPAAP